MKRWYIPSHLSAQYCGTPEKQNLGIPKSYENRTTWLVPIFNCSYFSQINITENPKPQNSENWNMYLHVCTVNWYDACIKKYYLNRFFLVFSYKCVHFSSFTYSFCKTCSRILMIAALCYSRNQKYMWRKHAKVWSWKEAQFTENSTFMK